MTDYGLLLLSGPDDMFRWILDEALGSGGPVGLWREEALFHYTAGSAWFSQEEVLKGRLKPGQYADLAVLNAPYPDVGDDDLKGIQSDLIVAGGRIVHAQDEFEDLSPALPARR